MFLHVANCSEKRLMTLKIYSIICQLIIPKSDNRIKVIKCFLQKALVCF